MPDIPELEDETMARVYGEYNWNVNYERAMENAMDPSHAPYVHGNRFGNPDKPEVADFDVVLTEWSGLADIPLYPPPGNPKGAWGKLLPQVRRARAASRSWSTRAPASSCRT